MKYKFGFIGCGNMGGALVKATSKNFSKNEIIVFDKFQEKLLTFSDVAVIASSLEEVIKNSKIIVIGVKPQAYEDTFNEIKPIIQKESVLVSMAAGVSISGVKNYLGFDYPIIRIMPNLPCQIGKGVVLYTTNNLVKEEDKALFIKAMQSAGVTDEILEDDIDAASCISGCGPAFVYMYINALKKAGESLGLSPEKALLYAMKTVEGSAVNVEKTGEDLEVLIQKVCSPGGTTIEGVNYFNENGLYDMVEKALTCSYEKTLKLKK